MKLRRVVTGHNEAGKAVIVSDGLLDNIKTMKSGNRGALVWMTERVPAPVEGEGDPATLDMGITPPPGGVIFRILEVAPGKPPFMHCTDTIDYCIVLEGRCTMLLDEDQEVEMKAGDVLVQRGTWHGWANRSEVPCRLVFVLVDASAPSKRLHDAQ